MVWIRVGESDANTDEKRRINSQVRNQVKHTEQQGKEKNIFNANYPEHKAG